MSKAKSRFPVLTSERLRHLMIGSKLRMEKAEQEQVCMLSKTLQLQLGTFRALYTVDCITYLAMPLELCTCT